MSRVSFDGLKSEFELGDKIGSVIEVYNGSSTEYETASWTVNKNGELILDTDYEYLKRKDSDSTGDAALLSVTDGYSLRLHFFYPYFTEEEMGLTLSEFFKNANNSNLSIHDFTKTFRGLCKKLPINPYDPNQPEDIKYILDGNQLISFMKKDMCRHVMTKPQQMQFNFEYADKSIKVAYNTGDTYDANWLKYPIYITCSQDTQDALRYSDFMWATLDKTITSASNGTKRLKFAKKTAVLELSSDIILENVCLLSKEGIRRGNYINLSTGVIDVIPQDSKELETSYKYELTPYKYNDQNRYRFHIPPQKEFDGNLHFTMGGKSIVLKISEKLTELKENHLYRININSAGECSLTINNWENGQSIVLWDKL